jgi:D-3-phosphoglycerate dehydrogenase / 2-oxoglutarate reductase
MNERIRPRIAVTPRSISLHGHAALDALTAAGFELVFPAPGRQPTINELVSTLPGCVGYLAGVEPVPGDVLRMCAGLKAIARNGIGVDNIDLHAASVMGVAVGAAPGANARGVAELTIALMLSGLRFVSRADAQLKAGAWSRGEGLEVEGRVLGLIGCGQVGKLVARMAIGLGMRVRAFDAYPDHAFDPGGDFAFDAFEAVLRAAAVVSLHCPPAERLLMDERALALLRPGAYLINTARASLIDEAAVLSALNDGRLRGYATDVHAVEPPGLTALIAHPATLATPHIGGYTAESIDRATRAAVAFLLEKLTDESNHN